MPEGGKQLSQELGCLSETLPYSDDLRPGTEDNLNMCLVGQGRNKHSLEAHKEREAGQRAAGGLGMAGLDWVVWRRVRGLGRTCPTPELFKL